MGSGARLLPLWIVVALLWVLPVRFFARNAAFFPLWPVLLYLALVVGVSLFAIVYTVQWLRRRV